MPCIVWVISLFGLILSLSGTTERNHCNPQASRSDYREYLHVLRYLLFIVISLKQKGVMQTYTFADIKARYFRETFAVRVLQAYSSASLLSPLVL